MKKVYIVRKYVVATSASDAIKKEKKQNPDDVFLDDTSQRLLVEQTHAVENNIGYK